MPGMQATTHVVDPVYATPVLRAPTPAESINTEYGRDETSSTDAEQDEEEFARHVEEEIGLRRTTWAEAGYPRTVILPRPPKDSKEEQVLFERVMKNLRERVKELEDEELFDKVVQFNPGPSYVNSDPSQQDVETILRNMYLSPSSEANPPKPSQMQTQTQMQTQNVPSASSFTFTANSQAAVPSYPSTFARHLTPQPPASTANGDSIRTTRTGRRYGNLGRNQ